MNLNVFVSELYKTTSVSRCLFPPSGSVLILLFGFGHYLGSGFFSPVSLSVRSV